MKATKQYFYKLVFVKMCMVAVTFYNKNEILNFDHRLCLLCCTRWFLLLNKWMKSERKFLSISSFSMVIFIVICMVIPTILSLGWNPNIWPLIKSY